MAAEAEASPDSPERAYIDTSALAKWYLNEELSDRVEEYLRSLPWGGISSLQGQGLAAPIICTPEELLESKP